MYPQQNDPLNEHHSITCNCRRKEECMRKSRRLSPNECGYNQVAVTTESYVRPGFKFQRMEQKRHSLSPFQHPNRQNKTEVSKFARTLKEGKTPCNLTWRVFNKCDAYSTASKKIFSIILSRSLHTEQKNKLAFYTLAETNSCSKTVD